MLCCCQKTKTIETHYVRIILCSHAVPPNMRMYTCSNNVREEPLTTTAAVPRHGKRYTTILL